MRKTFVAKASRELIKQLLDDLLEDEVLNDGQKDSIIEENSSTADKARALIDTVKRKGDAASSRMITHLHDRDSTLHAELGLAPGQPSGLASGQPPGQPAEPAPLMEPDWSDTLIRSTEAFWKEKLNDSDTYPAAKEAMRHRVALLITNITFTDASLNRSGAEKDEENMQKLLTDLGYEVVKRTNLTAKAIDDALIQFSKHPKLKETDSVVVVIMSHGKLGSILGVDWRDSGDDSPDEFPINNIYKHLGSEKCPALLNKTKIIMIQACRGGKEGSVLVNDGLSSAVVCDDAGEENIMQDDLRYVNREKDFISLLSCTPDTVSYRQRDRGSFLIQYVVEVLNTFAHRADIEELFRKVQQRFEDFCIQNKRQMPTKDRCTLTRRFYFFPGL